MYLLPLNNNDGHFINRKFIFNLLAVSFMFLAQAPKYYYVDSLSNPK